MHLNPPLKRALLLWALPVLVISAAINIAYAFDLVSGLPMITEDTARYFFSASFQGLAAIMGLLFIAFVFVYERLERRVDDLRGGIPAIVEQIRGAGFSYRDGSLLDEELLESLRTATSGTLRNYKMTFSEELKRLTTGEAPRWPIESFRGWEKNAHKLVKTCDAASSFFRELNSAEKKLGLAMTMLAESIAPLALPLIVSLSCLALIDMMSIVTVSELVVMTLVQAVYGFLWLLRQITNWTISSITRSITSQASIEFELDINESRTQLELELRAVEDALDELEGALAPGSATAVGNGGHEVL